MGKIKHYREKIKDGGIKEMRKQLAWIYGYGRRHLFAIVLYTMIGMAGTVVALLSSLVSRDLVDIITGHQTGKLIYTFVMIILTQLAGMFITQVTSFISTKVNLKVENDIKADLYDRLMTTKWEELSKYHSGDIISRWSGSASTVASGILNTFPNMVIALFRFFAALWMVVRVDPSFAVFALLSFPISYASSRLNLKRMQKNNMSGYEINAKMSAFTQESFGNVQTVKAFDLIGSYSRRLRLLLKEYSEMQLKYQKNSVINSLILLSVSMLVTYTTYGWGVYKVWSGAITYGTMTMFLSLSSTLSGTIQGLVNMIPGTIMLTNASKRIMEVIDLDKEDYSLDEDVEEFWKKHINEGVGLELKDVSFEYMNGTKVFSNVNMIARPREVVALVGPSGEGKTTMLRVLLALVFPSDGEGRIVSGEDFMPLTASARKLTAYVPQGNTMFAGTIAENMRNVCEEATDDEIIEALKKACAWDFVGKLEDGINSKIGERGSGFSEGQAQRLSIARALLKKAPILMLDEATSALDIETEKSVIRNIMSDEYPRTTIVTTHRPSVLNACNRVYRIHSNSCDIMTAEAISRLQLEFVGGELSEANDAVNQHT